MATMEGARRNPQETHLSAANLDRLETQNRNGPAWKIVGRLIWNLRQARAECVTLRTSLERILEEGLANQPYGELLDRMPPNDLDTEMAIVGAVLLDPSLTGSLGLTNDDFFDEACRTLWNRMVTLLEQRTPIDIVTLYAGLKEANEFEAIGGAWMIASVQQACPCVGNAGHYAEILKRHTAKRTQLRQALNTIKEVWS